MGPRPMQVEQVAGDGMGWSEKIDGGKKEKKLTVTRNTAGGGDVEELRRSAYGEASSIAQDRSIGGARDARVEGLNERKKSVSTGRGMIQRHVTDQSRASLAVRMAVAARPVNIDSRIWATRGRAGAEGGDI